LEEEFGNFSDTLSSVYLGFYCAVWNADAV